MAITSSHVELQQTILCLNFFQAQMISKECSLKNANQYLLQFKTTIYFQIGYRLQILITVKLMTLQLQQLFKRQLIMIKILRASFNLGSSKNVSDIISNYTHVTGCDRVKQIAKQAYLSATDYHNGQHYSHLTDLLSFPAARLMHRKMSEHPIGQRILKQKLRITDSVYRSLADLKQHTFGKQYYNFMHGLNFSPSERPIVRYIPDLEYAYVLQRYKQIHDFLHVLLAKQISVDQQLVIKWFQMRQLGLPSATLASLISPILSKSFNLKEVSNTIRIADQAEFVMNIYFQEHFSQNIDQVRRKFKFQ